MSEISILMAVYNGMPYLPEAVRSIRAQTFEDWTFVIIDDGSSDGTADYLDGLDDPRIRVVHQENQGLGAALNRGLELCDTEFLARMDSDDIAYPTRLQEQLDFLREHPEVGLLGTQIQRLGESRIGGSSLLPIEHTTIYQNLLEGRPGIYHPTMMCRTALLKEIGGYWEDDISEDWDMFLRMGERTQLANLNRVLLSYRIHTGSLCGAKMAVVRSRVAYACECAKRRAAKLPAIEYEEFVAAHEAKSPWRKALQAIDLYARTQYRLALTELLGPHRLRGYARLGWAAMCSPHLTLLRITRVIHNWWARFGRTPAAPS